MCVTPGISASIATVPELQDTEGTAHCSDLARMGDRGVCALLTQHPVLIDVEGDFLDLVLLACGLAAGGAQAPGNKRSTSLDHLEQVSVVL